MNRDYIQKCERLSAEDAFRIMFGGYEYLRDMPENPDSGTYKLLMKITAGDPETLIKCYRKMVEEQDEALGVIIGRHLDEGFNRKDNMINETEQSIYWPGLVVVGRKTGYDVIDLPRFIGIGFDGIHPVEVRKEFKLGIDGRPDKEAIIAFRRSLVRAGRLLYDFNNQLGAEYGEIEPKDLAVWDLRQMADPKRKYLHPYLIKNGLLEPE